MKAIKTLLAVSVLAAAGAASAATVGSYTETQTATSILYQGFLELTDPSLPRSGTGTASLDDSGVLSVTTTNFHLTTILGTDSFNDYAITVSGGWDGTTFSASSASVMYTGCTNGPGDGANNTCSSVALNSPMAFSASGSATLAGGTITIASLNDPNAVSTYSIALAPAVPVPAAAWLFGSGLLGLAGTARRRRAA